MFSSERTPQDKVFEHVYNLMIRGGHADLDVAEELEGKPPGAFTTPRFVEEDNEAIFYLLNDVDHDTLSQGYVELMKRYVRVELEAGRLRDALAQQQEDERDD